MMRLTKESLLSTLPVVIAEDADLYALASVIAGAIADRVGEIDLARIYPRIEELPEALCDILAYDFKIDWWDPAAPLSEKRETLRRSWYVHRHMGTKSAVERAIGAGYPGSTVKEWFEYDGEPYHFRMSVPIGESETSGEGDGYKDRIFWLIDCFKNLRSTMDEIRFERTLAASTEIVVNAVKEYGLSITEFSEVFPEVAFEAALWLLTHTARMSITRSYQDFTGGGLITRPNDEEREITIMAGFPFEGAHALEYSASGDTITIINEGVTVTTDDETQTLIITGG